MRQEHTKFHHCASQMLCLDELQQFSNLHHPNLLSLDFSDAALADTLADTLDFSDSTLAGTLPPLISFDSHAAHTTW